MCMSNIEIYKLPYVYYGGGFDFNVYVIYGNRMESNDHEFLKDLYQNHEILRNVYNLDFYHISLTKDEAIITIKEYKEPNRGCSGFSNRVFYLGEIKDGFLERNLPTTLFNKLKPSLGSISSSFNKKLYSGINYQNGNSGNLSLFDWIYDEKK